MTIAMTILMTSGEIHFHGHSSHLLMIFMTTIFGVIIFFVAFKQPREARILADVPKAPF